MILLYIFYFILFLFNKQIKLILQKTGVHNISNCYFKIKIMQLSIYTKRATRALQEVRQTKISVHIL